jgi:hypothetical protein
MRSTTILTIFPNPHERVPRALPAAPSERREAPGPATPAGVSALPSIESVILQKLLSEMESRQLARTPPTYVIDQAPAPRRDTLVRTLWCTVWALSLVVCVFIVKYIDSQTMAPHMDAGQTQALENLAVSVGDQKKEFSAVIDSLQGLASAIATSSRRTASIPEMLNRLGSDLEQIHSPPARQAVELPPVLSTQTPEADVAAIPMGGHHHPPLESAIVAPPDAVVHHNSLGVMDYWLLPHTVSGVRNMAKVVPISQTSAGTFVHDVGEVKDYIITPSGVWIAATEAGDQ